jgi:hypothetical protein
MTLTSLSFFFFALVCGNYAHDDLMPQMLNTCFSKKKKPAITCILDLAVLGHDFDLGR